jgi:hypothetical protein
MEERIAEGKAGQGGRQWAEVSGEGSEHFDF